MKDWIPQLIFVWGDYIIERHATNFFRNFLKPGMIFMDIGANIGYYSLIGSKIIGDKGKVFSFEPVSRNIRILHENIQLNDFINIAVIPKGLSNEIRDNVKIYLPTDEMCGMGSLMKLNDVNYTGEYELISTTTFEKFAKDNNINKVDIIKIDVEGNELNVLRGMENNLKDEKFSPVLLIELTEFSLTEFSVTIKDIIEYLNGFGYKAFKINEKSELVPKEDYGEEFVCVFKKNLNNSSLIYKHMI